MSLAPSYAELAANLEVARTLYRQADEAYILLEEEKAKLEKTVRKQKEEIALYKLFVEEWRRPGMRSLGEWHAALKKILQKIEEQR